MGSSRSFAFSTLEALELQNRHGISRVTATTAFSLDIYSVQHKVLRHKAEIINVVPIKKEYRVCTDSGPLYYKTQSIHSSGYKGNIMWRPLTRIIRTRVSRRELHCDRPFDT